MFFKNKPKTKPIDINLGLELYNKKENEPISSVMESSDYIFATSQYNKNDFRYPFTSKYKEYTKNVYDIVNCKFERPREDSNFINFYIYLWIDLPDVDYRIEDDKHYLVTAFYEVLKQVGLPGITEKTRIQFFVKNIKQVINGYCLNMAWHDIHLNITKIFPEVADLSFWSVFYIFIYDELLDETINNSIYIERLKKYCYDAAKKYDTSDVLDYDNFKIRIDGFDIYHEISGQNYFNSDYMFNCLLI